MTSIIPPGKCVSGVANSECDIDEGYSTVAGIQETLLKCRVKNATAAEYADGRRHEEKAWKKLRAADAFNERPGYYTTYFNHRGEAAGR